MKLAPTTTTCLADVAFTTIALLSANERKYKICEGVTPSSGSSTGSAPVASNSAPYSYVLPSSVVIFFCLVSSDVAREFRTRSIFRSEYHSGGRSGIHSSSAVPARKSFERLGRSQGGALSALIIVNGPLYPSRRSMSAAASPAAPPPMMMIEEGCTVVDTRL